MTTKNAICGWDFTAPAEHVSLEEILKFCQTTTKQYAFQLEKATTTGYLHYQGRISLKIKTRKMIGSISPKVHWSPTSGPSNNNVFYVMKAETRLKGPWTDKDAYIPRQVRGITLKTWQQAIVDNVGVWDTRTINVVFDNVGNIGKSTLVTYMGCHGMARRIPVMQQHKDLMRMVMDCPTSQMYLIDFPRAINKKEANGFWSAIEEVKNGYAYDDRYSFKEKYFDCPNIWVFTNVLPEPYMLSNDRWRYWRVEDDELKSYNYNTISVYARESFEVDSFTIN